MFDRVLEPSAVRKNQAIMCFFLALTFYILLCAVHRILLMIQAFWIYGAVFLAAYACVSKFMREREKILREFGVAWQYVRTFFFDNAASIAAGIEVEGMRVYGWMLSAPAMLKKFCHSVLAVLWDLRAPSFRKIRSCLDGEHVSWKMDHTGNMVPVKVK